MSSKNPATRKRQRQRKKERVKANRQREREQRYEKLSLKYSPYEEDRFMQQSCASKNRYDTEEKAIRACITASANRGVKLSWYKCGRCNGWHITSRPMRTD